MLMQRPARVLYDNQIDFRFVTADVFEERDFYHTEITDVLMVNGVRHELFVVPYAEYLSLSAASGLAELIEKGGQVVFVDALPHGVSTGEPLPERIKDAAVISLAELPHVAHAQRSVVLQSKTDRVRVLHYIGAHELYFFFNEGDIAYRSMVQLPHPVKGYIYDAWKNLRYPLEGGGDSFELVLEPYQSQVVIMGATETLAKPASTGGAEIELAHFSQSVCRSIDYPNFTHSREISALEGYEKANPKFSGFIRYETSVMLPEINRAVLEITDAHEGVEVFVGSVSAGIQVQPPFMFDLSSLVQVGENKITIEVATTLARERNKKCGATGITGSVSLYITEG